MFFGTYSTLFLCLIVLWHRSTGLSENQRSGLGGLYGNFENQKMWNTYHNGCIAKLARRVKCKFSLDKWMQSWETDLKLQGQTNHWTVGTNLSGFGRANYGDWERRRRRRRGGWFSWRIIGTNWINPHRGLRQPTCIYSHHIPDIYFYIWPAY